MIVRKRLTLVAAAALTCAGLVGAAPASADGTKEPAPQPGVTVLATGLQGPRQLSSTSKYLYVAEYGANQITRVAKSDGATKEQVSDAAYVQGVVRTGGKFYIASGDAPPPEAKRTVNGSAEILVAKTHKAPKTFADLLAYELKYNPDNQTQFGDDGAPLDTLSNPYFVVKSKIKGGFLLVADAGANDILAVSKSGKVSTFFVPPPITTGKCATTDQNSDAGPSCDPVPTGLAWGRDGNLYISGVSSLEPGEGRVYQVNQNGKLLQTWTGFDAATGVAVGDDGSVYVSELTEGVPSPTLAKATASRSVIPNLRLGKDARESGPDPSTFGRITKIAPNGDRTYVQVTLPGGLLFTDGTLYATAWSAAAELHIPHPGEIVTVDTSAFSPCGKQAKC